METIQKYLTKFNVFHSECLSIVGELCANATNAYPFMSMHVYNVYANSELCSNTTNACPCPFLSMHENKQISVFKHENIIVNL